MENNPLSFSSGKVDVTNDTSKELIHRRITYVKVKISYLYTFITLIINKILSVAWTVDIQSGICQENVFTSKTSPESHTW